MVKNKIFLCGPSGAGKSFAISAFLERNQQLNLAGFLSVFDRPAGEAGRQLFITDARKRGIPIEGRCAALARPDGGWEVYPEVFDTDGVAFLTPDDRPDLFIMDELGFMERNAPAFQRRVMEIIDSDVPVLGVIKPLEQRERSRFLTDIAGHPAVELLTVSREDRDGLQARLERLKIF